MKIKYARLHQAAFHPDLGDLTSVFPPPNRTFCKFEMTRDASGDLLVNAQLNAGSKLVRIIIPKPTIACLGVADNE
jgi:hypothetical protein